MYVVLFFRQLKKGTSNFIDTPVEDKQTTGERELAKNFLDFQLCRTLGCGR
jgi:hypothetical protein